jgi:hypothetical protein
MSESDKIFAGSVPEFYDTYLVPLIFEAYANDIASRTAALKPKSVLEVAAGSGVVTRALPEVPSRSAPSGWWKRPVFRRPCLQQSNAWRDHVQGARRRSRLHNRRHVQTTIGGTAPSCRAIRSCRYGYRGKHLRRHRLGQEHHQALDKQVNRRQR